MSDEIRNNCLPCKACLIRPRLKLDGILWMLVCGDEKHLNRAWGKTTREVVLRWNELHGTTGPQEIVQVKY